MIQTCFGLKSGDGGIQPTIYTFIIVVDLDGLGLFPKLCGTCHVLGVGVVYGAAGVVSKYF